MRQVVISKSFVFEVLIMMLVASSSFLFYCYLLVPNEKDVVFFGFRYSTPYFESAQYAAWHLVLKGQVVYLLIIWYLFCNYWWRNFLLFPFYFFTYLFVSIFIVDVIGFSVSTKLVLHMYTIILTSGLVVFRNYLFNFSKNAMYLRHIRNFEKSLISSNKLNESNLAFRTILSDDSINNIKIRLKNLVLLKSNLQSNSKISLGESDLNLLERSRADYILCLFLITSPLLFFLYKLVPVKESIEIGNYTITATIFYDLNMMSWYLMNKIIPLILLCIWFVKSENWWKHSILIPITVYIYQIVAVLGQKIDIVDEYEFIQSLPITIPIILLLIWLSRKMNYVSLTKDLILEIEKEINRTLDQLASQEREKEKQSFTERLAHLKATKSQYTKDEYLLQMVKLRNEIE
ncbi:hypothetical protein [Spongiivirga citrea]|uniref:Uncharacterized protein n=1 Tax=Spongiivirga citrea TaxID=1481457 RepID=A0A6M0CNU3_9FLAO|nr:hypothetical protein [Spongiivirga citrea]NER15610.1 hypothetical protein [Spongiivirga citrea]